MNKNTSLCREFRQREVFFILVRKLKKRELVKREIVASSVLVAILVLLTIRLAVLQLFPSEQVVNQYQNHQSESISNASYMVLDTNGKDMMSYTKQYIIVIDKKPFSLNNYEETLEDLMAFNFIMKGEDPNFNYTDVMKSKGKLYYTVSEETYNKVKKLDNIKGLYYYAYDNVDRRKAWKVSNFLSNLPKEEDIVKNSLQEEIYNNVKDNDLPSKKFYLDDKAIYGKNEVDISDKNRNLKLTLDLDVENKIREVLSSDKYKGFDNIGVTIMEADTGKIRAMVQKDESEPNVNLGIEGNGYEPGSIFKLITLGIALDKGIVSMNDTYTCTGKICSLGVHGTQTIEQALLNSCNDVYAKVGEKVGYVTMMDYCKKLGLFSEVLNISGPRQNETKGIKPDLEDGMTNISIGQCMTLSPLQMLGAINAIVNGGEYIKPYLLESIVDKDNNLIKEYSSEKERLFSSTTSKILMKSMKSVVNSGTGRMAKVNGIEVGGKTGTANTSEEDIIHCWFSGYYKNNDKYYTMVVIVPNIKSVNDDGKELGGSNTAAPIFADIVKSIAK